MQPKDPLNYTKEINECIVTIKFLQRPNEVVFDNIKSILSTAYDERLQLELIDYLK